MKMKAKLHRFTLKNSFHGTECTVLHPCRNGETSQRQVWQDLDEEASREWRAGPARSRVNRVRRTLCGMEDCQCGTVRP